MGRRELNERRAWANFSGDSFAWEVGEVVPPAAAFDSTDRPGRCQPWRWGFYFRFFFFEDPGAGGGR